MCQIIGISNISGLLKTEISTLALTARKLMKSQSSGFGFAYSTLSRAKKEHAYYVEKYTNPDHFNGIGTVGFTKRHFDPILNAVEVPMLSSGHPDAPTGPMIIHGRTATTPVNLNNTHPFRKKGWALIHNGVVDMPMEPEDVPEDSQYIELLKSRYSSCDSEWLLNTYAFGNGHNDWYDYLCGYAATMTISPNNKLIVAKDDTAKLYISAIPKLNESLVFSTIKSYPALLAASIGMQATPAFEMLGNKVITIHPEEGGVLVEKFQGIEDDTTINSYEVNKALGYNVKDHYPETRHWSADNTKKNKKKRKKVYPSGVELGYRPSTTTTVKNQSTGQLDFIH